MSLRDTYLQVKKSTGHTPKELKNQPVFPKRLEYLWDAFCQLNKTRTMGYDKPNSLTYTEIKSFVQVTGTVLSSRDIKAIVSLDDVYLGCL